MKENQILIVSLVPSEPKSGDSSLAQVFAVFADDLSRFISDHLSPDTQMIVRHVVTYLH